MSSTQAAAFENYIFYETRLSPGSQVDPMTGLVIQLCLFPRGFEILDHFACLINKFSSKIPSDPGKLTFCWVTIEPG